MSMDEVTQQNAALVEEAASASESLDEQARTLEDLVSFFNLGEGGNQTSQNTRRRVEKTTAEKRERSSGSRNRVQSKDIRRNARSTPVADDDSEWEEF